MSKIPTKSQFKRRIFWGTALIVLVLFGVGVWFYNFYFASTDAAIRHAEALIFRRMTVAQLAEQGEYRFYFVTNRRPGANGGSLEERFRRDREALLKFGFFDAEIKPSLGRYQSLRYEVHLAGL